MAEIHKLLEEAKGQWAALAWEGSFEEYLNMVIANPAPARHSHARIYDMIQWAGVVPGPEGVPQYQLFAGEIFGLDKALDRLVQFFHAAAQGLEVRKRVLLLMGPPASGKSSMVTLLKAGLERYSRTDQGALYAISGCPMQEEPLHLIPDERRQEMARDYGLYIEGDLCPRCRYKLRHDYGGDIARVKVERVQFSQSAGLGIGTFVATSPQSQDISRLVGSVDTASLTHDRLEGAGVGLRLDGELEAANRGIMEFIEIFKSDERFLTVMLGVSQEQVIKLDTFGSVHADEAIIAHSNEEEYNSFINNKESAALRDRLILVRIPYNLRVRDEVKIYSKLLQQGGAAFPEGPQGHSKFAPLTLHVAALLAVLSRLEVTERGSGLLRVPVLDKMKLYDGRTLPPYTGTDVERLQEESPREGMFGLSPRYVINRLADAKTRERGCLTPPKTLKSLVEGLVERAGISKEERERVVELVREVVREYKNLAIREVKRAATENFHERATQLFESYVLDAESFSSINKADTATTKPLDERLMRRVENALNLRDAERPHFRGEVYETYRYFQQNPDMTGPSYDWIPMLKLAIENILFPSQDEIKPAIDPRGKNPERQRIRDRIVERLISESGYCEECAHDLMHFVWMTLRGKEVISAKGTKISWE